MSGKKDTKLTLSFSKDVMDVLITSVFITVKDQILNPNSLSFEIDSATAKNVQDLVKNNSKMNTLSLSQIFIIKLGRFLMKPIITKQTHSTSLPGKEFLNVGL